jgi:hypothetical protein
MTKGLFSLLLAGALTVPHVTPALGNDSTVIIRHAPTPQANGGALQLPPIPYLDTLPWQDTGARGPKVDTLIGPKLDTLGPLLVEPGNPVTGLLAAARRDRSLGDALTTQWQSRRIATEQHTG